MSPQFGFTKKPYKSNLKAYGEIELWNHKFAKNCIFGVNFGVNELGFDKDSGTKILGDSEGK